MKLFEGKTIVITGAASGMGRALAEKLVAAGADVVATDVNEAGLASLAASLTGPGKLETARLDVTDGKAFEALVERVAARGLDYLFNNAGIGYVREVTDTTADEWERTIRVNQYGVMHGTLAAYRVMIRQQSGHIVNTGSIAGLMPAPMMTAYSMTKHAVVGLSLSLREEAKVHGVKVSVVCPGIVETNIVGAKDMRDLGLEGDDPFAFVRKNARIKTISAAEAADFILRGVARNQPEIIFPLHGRLGVATFHNMRRVWEAGVAAGLKVFRRSAP